MVAWSTCILGEENSVVVKLMLGVSRLLWPGDRWSGLRVGAAEWRGRG